MDNARQCETMRAGEASDGASDPERSQTPSAAECASVVQADFDGGEHVEWERRHELVNDIATFIL